MRFSKPISIDFAEYDRTMKRGVGGRSLLLKALGLTKTPGLRILDATGGLMRDAFFIAKFGGDVTAIERSPVLAEMIKAALAVIPALTVIPAKAGIQLQFIEGNAIEIIPSLPAFDVIYLDPMFREEKSAKAKKDLQFLQALHKDEVDDAEALLDIALKHATLRVVVKRAKHAPYLGGHQPDWSLESKTIRFDIFKPCSYQYSL